MDLNFISLIVMILFYLFAGISHFKNPKFFLLITPKWVYKPELVNIIIGFAEIILALGLILETTRSISAIGIIGTIIRLPIQALLIYWAYVFI
jgi:uncharacterized membrane protein